MTAQTSTLPRPFLGRLGETLRSVVAAFANASTGMACAREAERLFAMSDAELARRGLTRDRVIPHAFARYLAN